MGLDGYGPLSKYPGITISVLDSPTTLDTVGDWVSDAGGHFSEHTHWRVEQQLYRLSHNPIQITSFDRSKDGYPDWPVWNRM